ncbi:hypothetical protein FSW04_19225 [Baekduia soli]|uniref:DUF1844 domain-containing protein n=1 Tax=Baekduia soli TaxID=496014 RepID=A0A5B8U937_9ACTN|nr:hypothetical protein [Baekduia soli]QEC49487.1 hypothetical protein FSW04_19225 [Baekduia soli]
MTDNPQQPPANEAEMRAAYEAQLEQQLRQLRVEDVIVQTIVTLVNLGGRRAGLAPGTEDERDPEQLRLAIEGARALLPLIEAELGPDGKAIRDALSQLQLAYAQLAAGAGAAPGTPGEPAPPRAAGPASSRPARAPRSPADACGCPVSSTAV